ncbi:methylamine dehydrogenase heavy chain [Novosphingobium sp. CF614]|uniref:amine dehydrogenase large subunit n=1 Tax=Novosphingobium sp. CF614 TaxID=1884364 RepID=UPI0008F14B34|nr:amine dehydrogenase large subunit [Novosphingobium sp. CF614]SFF91483.1 methylamine dehydrogenase heavy chain [Novosphingobium sp. CF614]
MKSYSGFRFGVVAALALSGPALYGIAAFAPAANAKDPNGLEPEESDTATIEAPQAGWFYVRGGWEVDGTAIYDGKSGKMKGIVASSQLSDMAIDPAGKYYYISETIWSKGNRGTRQDMVSVYDSQTLKLVTEIPIPSRILVDERKQNFVLSADGRWGFIYSFSPAQAVNVVDLAKRKFVKTVELPGCAALIPNPGVGFSALCSDGTMATVTDPAGKAAITHGPAFFAASDDPIFENFAYDKAKNTAIFVSYTGLVYTAKMGASPEVSAPFSLQEAAGYAPAVTKPLSVAWYPGSRQPAAYNAASGELFVLMHMGEYWSHKAFGDEIWVLDVAARKVVRRLALKEPVGHIEVTQQAEPLIFVNDEKSEGMILDGRTGEELHRIETAGSGVISVASGS